MSVRQVPLRRSLFLQFFGMSVLPLLAVMLIVTAVMFKGLKDEVERQTTTLGSAMRDQIEARLAGRESAVELLGHAVNQAIEPEADRQLMLQLMRTDPFMDAVYEVGGAGTVKLVVFGPNTDRHEQDMLGIDLSSRPFYEAARATQNTVWSDTFLSTLTGRVAAAVAVHSGSNLLVAEISLQSLSRSVAELAEPAGDLIMILDSRGRIIGYKDGALASRQVSVKHLDLVREGIAGRAVSGRFDWDGTRYVGSVSPIGRTGWTVLVGRSTPKVYAQVFRLGWALAGGLSVALLGALVAALTLARNSERRYRKLLEVADSYVQAREQKPIRFDILEFDQMWQNLRRLFEQVEQRDAQTRAARQQLQTVFDATTEVSIIAARADGVITVFNRGAEKLLGYEAADMVGRQNLLRLHDETELAQRARELSVQFGRPVAHFETLAAVPAESGYEVRDWTYIRHNGSRLSVSVAITAVRHGEQGPTGYLAVATDQTEHLRAAGLEMARQVAEASSQSKSEFLSRVSHDLRTPLNAMLGFAQLLAMDTREPLTKAQRDRVSLIEAAGWHLVRLIDDILDLSRIDSGQLRVSMEAVELVPALNDAVRLVAAQAAQCGVMISHPLPSDASARGMFAWADRTRLIQVLVNLLTNAVKYNVQGGQVNVRIDASEPANLAIMVSDTGRGMSPEQLERMFQPFDRLGMEGSAIAGTGIGLVIVKRLLELMDGDIQVQSKVGQGTRVTVRFRRGAAVEVADAPLSEPMGLPFVSDDILQVVCIEDNAVNNALVEQIFALRPSLRLHVANTRQQGLALIRRVRPRLILLDLHLPDGSGLGVLEAIRQDADLAATPVIVVSADATSASLRAATEAGAQAFLSKPIQIPKALAAIDAALSGR